MRLVLTILMASVLSGLCVSATIHVPGNYPTIQQGINAAANGDTVLVDPGIYYERIDFVGKAIIVKSSKGAEVTVIDANHIGRVVYFHSGEGLDSVLDGFTLMDGDAFTGGGIYCYQTSPTIKNNIISGNSSKVTGGGISCAGASPFILNNMIIDNSSANGGGGIHCSSYSKPTITNNIFSGNSTNGSGGGIYCLVGSDVVLTNNTIVANTANSGGGFLCEGASPIIMNSILWDNIAPTGPEIHLKEHASSSTLLTISYSDVEGGQPNVQVDPNCTLNWGSGMIDSDPLFIDGAEGDLHLGYLSPCRNTGAGNAYLPTEDFEGDPRIAYGTADMGADEFYTHLYYTGNASPNHLVNLKIIGQPKQKTVLWIGNGVLDPPWTTKNGLWYLVFPVAVVVTGSTNWDGLFSSNQRIPPSCPVPKSFFLQGFVRDQLTNLCVMEVQ